MRRKSTLKKFKSKLRPGVFAFLKHIGLELVIFWVSLALIVFVLVIVFKPLIEQWLLDFFIRAQQTELQTELGEEILPEPSPVSPSRPSIPIPKIPLQGSFGDSFSGVGWRNPVNSNVYQDFKTLTISFPPAYDWDEVARLSDVFAERRVLVAKGNGKEVLFVTSAGEVGLFDSNESIRFIDSVGDFDFLAVDYDEASRAWFLVNVLNGKTEIIKLLGNPAVMEIPAALNRLDLKCLNSRCLLVTDKRLFGLSKTFGGWDAKEISLPYEAHSVGIGKTNSDFLVGLVWKSGEQYKGGLYEISDGELREFNADLFSSQYGGEISFGTNDAGEILALYAAYEGKAYKISASITEDYSRFFNTRVMQEGKVRPEIFYKDGLSGQGAWWISSAASSPLPKFLRIRGGVANDLTPVLIDKPFFQLVQGFDSNILYGIVGDESSSRIYRFRDAGFERHSKLVWESLRLNVWEGEIVRGRFTYISDGPPAGDPALAGGGNIKYFLSNNGGKSWQEAELNKFIQFEKKGGDFRWRAELYPSKDGFQSPWISQVRAEYYIIRK